MQIKITDSKGRDAEVAAGGVTAVEEVRWVDDEGAGVINRRILRGSAAHDIEALTAEYGDLDKLGEALVEADPEVDIEAFGAFLEDVSRVYVNPAGEVCHRVTHYEILCDPDGSEKDHHALAVGCRRGVRLARLGVPLHLRRPRKHSALPENLA